MLYLVTGKSSSRIPRATELGRVHTPSGHCPEGGPEVRREERIEDRVQAWVAVRQTVGDDLEDDQAAELDVVDAKALEEEYNLKHVWTCLIGSLFCGNKLSLSTTPHPMDRAGV